MRGTTDNKQKTGAAFHHKKSEGPYWTSKRANITRSASDVVALQLKGESEGRNGKNHHRGLKKTERAIEGKKFSPHNEIFVLVEGNHPQDRRSNHQKEEKKDSNRREERESVRTGKGGGSSFKRPIPTRKRETAAWNKT